MLMNRLLTIRRAHTGDAATLAALAGALGYPATESQMRVRLAEAGDSTRHGIFVGELESVVGWVHVSVTLSLESGDSAEIRGLVVDEAYRSGGIGGALVSAAEQWARERGHTRIRVRTNVARERTQQFYRKLGYRSTKRQEVFDKELGSGPSGT